MSDELFQKLLNSSLLAKELVKQERRKLWDKVPGGYPIWVQDNWTSRGKKLDFEKHKYLKQIYEDQSPIIVFNKSSQVGLTERLLTEAVWLPDMFKENSIYFFPTSSTASDLVQERIDDPVNANQYLSEVSGRAKKIMGKQADKVGLKRMSKGFLYFRGSNKPTQITSVSGDAIFVDELDRMVMQNVPFFDKRLEHSDRRWQRWASTPTIPNFGIHKKYLESDQHEYHVKCNHCNEWNNLTFWDNVDIEGVRIFCSKCQQTITPWQLEGQWIPAKPGAEVRGYHISQLYSPRLDLKKFVRESQKTAEWEVQQFYNQNLGLPYEPKGSKISEQDLDACRRDYKIPLRKDEAFMGVDVGKNLHIIIRDYHKVLFIGTRKDFDEIDSLMNDYNVKIVLFDAAPEPRSVQGFAKRFEGRVYYCYYTGLKEVKENEYFKKDVYKINTDRTISLDVAFDVIKKQKIELPKNLDDYPEFKSHLKNLSRVVREEKGRKVAEYLKVGDDHYAHAFNYANMAKDIFDGIAEVEVFNIR